MLRPGREAHSWRLAGRAEGRRFRVRDVVIATAIVLAGSIHLFFLAPVLPQVLPGLGVADADMVEMGGVLIFASAAAAAVGAGVSAARRAATQTRSWRWSG